MIDLHGKTKEIVTPKKEGEIPYPAEACTIESLWPKAKRLNLLSRGRHKPIRTPIAFSALVLAAMALMWLTHLVAPIYLENERLKDIESKIKAGKSRVKEVEALGKAVTALENEIASINAFKEQRPTSVNILKELTATLPKTAWLTRARVTMSTAEIEGYAAAATELLSKLEASKYFRKAEFASPTFRDPKANSDRFSIKMEIKGIKDIKAIPNENTKK